MANNPFSSGVQHQLWASLAAASEDGLSLDELLAALSSSTDAVVVKLFAGAKTKRLTTVRARRDREGRAVRRARSLSRLLTHLAAAHERAQLWLH